MVFLGALKDIFEAISNDSLMLFGKAAISLSIVLEFIVTNIINPRYKSMIMCYFTAANNASTSDSFTSPYFAV